DLRRGQSFIRTVVPFHQVGIGFCSGSKPSQFASARCPLQRAGEYFGECHSRQAFSKAHGIALAIRCQWQIGKSGMLARVSPSCVAMLRYIYDWKTFTHAILLVSTLDSLSVFRRIVRSKGRIRTRCILAAALRLGCGNAVVTTGSQPSSE